MGRIFVVTSGKGGVGKTTTAINLAAALNSLNEDVTLVDANLATPNIGIYLGAPVVPISLTHVLKGDAKVDEAIYEHESGTKVLPCSLSNKDLEKVKNNSLTGVTKKLSKISDYVILDCAAGLGEEAVKAINASDEVILVTNPELPSVTDALKTARIAQSMGKQVKGMIIARVKKDGLDMPYENVKEMIEVPVLGVIPEDKNMRKALVKKDAIIHTHPKSKASLAYIEIAKKITGKNYKSSGSFYYRILRALGVKR